METSTAMSSLEMRRSANFSTAEKRILEEIIVRFPVVEDKRKTNRIEEDKREAWETISNTFNSNENTNSRTTSQLKVCSDIFLLHLLLV